MKTTRKLIVVLLALVAVGFAKLPLEQQFAADLRARHLIQKPIDLGTRQSLGQTSYAIALGGLRSLVAAMLNLKAHIDFEHQEWGKLEDRYRTITTLQPHTRYYWDVASWHLAYNAYADYGDRPDIPDARRRFLQKEFLAHGRWFLEEGIRSNPDDWRLRQAYVRLLTDPFKPNDFPTAVHAIDEAIAQGPVPEMLRRERLYSLARIPERSEDSWEAIQELWKWDVNRGIPTVRLLYVVLQGKHAPPDQQLKLEEIFDNRQQALKYLSFYWLRQREGFPMDGVETAIRLLLKEFQIPDKYSPFNPEGWSGYPPELFES